MRVPEELQILNFPPNFSDDVETLDLLAVEDLDGHLVVGDLVIGG